MLLHPSIRRVAKPHGIFFTGGVKQLKNLWRPAQRLSMANERGDEKLPAATFCNES